MKQNTSVSGTGDLFLHLTPMTERSELLLDSAAYCQGLQREFGQFLDENRAVYVYYCISCWKYSCKSFYRVISQSGYSRIDCASKYAAASVRSCTRLQSIFQTDHGKSLFLFSLPFERDHPGTAPGNMMQPPPERMQNKLETSIIIQTFAGIHNSKQQ